MITDFDIDRYVKDGSFLKAFFKLVNLFSVSLTVDKNGHADKNSHEKIPNMLKKMVKINQDKFTVDMTKTKHYNKNLYKYLQLPFSSNKSSSLSLVLVVVDKDFEQAAQGFAPIYKIQFILVLVHRVQCSVHIRI